MKGNSHRNSMPKYFIGNCGIDPERKIISRYKMTGGRDEDGGEWDGFTYEPDTKIVYDETFMAILAGEIYFKEDLPKVYDLNSIKLLSNFSNDYTYMRDKNYIYKTSRQDIVSTTKIHGLKIINDFLYGRQGNLLFYDNTNVIEPSGLNKIVNSDILDLNTIKHIHGNYFYDKNGLYFFKLKISENSRLAHKIEEGGNAAAHWHAQGNYITYGESVYYYNPREIQKLNLNKDKIKYFEMGYYGGYPRAILADDKQFYFTYYGDLRDAGKLPQEFFRKDMNRWQIIFPETYQLITSDNYKTIHLPGGGNDFGGVMIDRTLVHTPDGFYTFDIDNPAETIVKADKVFIFNYDRKKYEELEPAKYRFLSADMYIYKERLHTHFAPVEEDINTSALKFVATDGVKTNFFYDGKSLIHNGSERTGISYRGEGSKMRILLSESMAAGVDITTLRVVSKNMLIDKNNIYTIIAGGYLQTVPVKELGFSVKVFAPAAELKEY